MSLLVPVRRNRAVAWPTFGALEHQLDRMFNPIPPRGRGDSVAWVPAVDIRETDEAYLIEADLPGLSKKDIEVCVVEDRVTIRGTRKREDKQEGKGYRRTERSEGAFERSFRVPGGIDGARVGARFQDGVLTVTLPKPEETKPRQINVNVK